VSRPAPAACEVAAITGRLLGTIDLPGTQASVPRARSWIREVLGCDHPVLDDVMLLVSEVTTNAVLHSESGAEGLVTLVAAVRCDVVHIDVIDAGSASAPRISGDLTGESGRGLFLVDQLSDRWGVYEDSAGRAVWFELGR
jgi:anti-sigma regulatory factor (Ser/Thr protein kinase)